MGVDKRIQYLCRIGRKEDLRQTLEEQQHLNNRQGKEPPKEAEKNQPEM